MNPIAINHPHAQTAILLASFNKPDSDYVAHELAVSGTPRRLYTLARLLRAAQQADDMAEIDRINATHPAIIAQAA